VKRSLLILPVLLAGCSFAPVRVPVADLEIPGNSSGGRICYAPVPLEESPPVGFNGADYRATALYQSEGEGTATVTVYGRSTPPEATCVLPSSADLPLSGPLVLTPGAAQEVLIGGPDYSATLAELIAEPGTYFGASLSGGVLLSLNERIKLTDGEISVYY
jgi:hypothetical protein